MKVGINKKGMGKKEEGTGEMLEGALGGKVETLGNGKGK